MKHPIKTDLIIIGAGPAGLSTAMHLLKQDQSWKKRLIIFEKYKHPRKKICGGGVTHFGLRILQHLDIPYPLPLTNDIVNNIFLKYRRNIIHIRGNPLFVVYNRSDFDYFLANEAKIRGLDIREDEEVKDIEVFPDFVRLTTNKGIYEAEVIVGADGHTGITRCFLHEKEKKNKFARTLKIWIPGLLSSPRFKDHSAVFDFSFINSGLHGYLWDFPNTIEGTPGYNQGVYDAQWFKNGKRRNLKRIFEQESNIANFTEENLKSSAIYKYHPSNSSSGFRIILVGDAAGVDGLFGEGIGPALWYGKIASQSVVDAFKNGEYKFTRYKNKIFFSKLGRYLFIRWMLANYVYRLGHIPIFSKLLWYIGQILAWVWRPSRF